MKIPRRSFLKAGAAASATAFATNSFGFASSGNASTPAAQNKSEFWPDGARFVISISMQMEAGAQPQSEAESPMPAIDPKYPDLPVSKW
jgi:secreted PhoX family phosphatase